MVTAKQARRTFRLGPARTSIPFVNGSGFKYICTFPRTAGGNNNIYII